MPSAFASPSKRQWRHDFAINGSEPLGGLVRARPKEPGLTNSMTRVSSPSLGRQRNIWCHDIAALGTKYNCTALFNHEIARSEVHKIRPCKLLSDYHAIFTLVFDITR